MRRAREAVRTYKGFTQVVKKQRPTGLWAANILGLGPSKWPEIKDIGTVAQYRRLLEMGVDPDDRTLQLTNRVFYRLLSRDPDPKLLHEFRKPSTTNPAVVPWARRAMNEGVAAALAQAGRSEDPRLRGSAQRIASDLSAFLRSEASENPIVKQGAKNVLDPEARPPSIYSIAMLAHLPGMQRDRAGLVDRLREFLTQPPPRREYVVKIGTKAVQPTTLILGEPIQNDSQGRPKDLPFALHWMELLARLGIFDASAAAQRAFHRLAKDCEDGAWTAKNLRSFPKSPSGLAVAAFPLEIDERDPYARRTDVTFRLALIARLRGMELEIV